MFGSRKRKEQRKAAAEAFAAESAATLESFKKQETDINAMSDMGERLYALKQLSQDIDTQLKKETDKIGSSKKYSNIGAASGALLTGGTAVALAALVSPAFILLIPTLPIVTSITYRAGEMIDTRSNATAVHQGLYTHDFVTALASLKESAEKQCADIVANQYDALSSSSLFDKALSDYPSIKEAFLQKARQKDAQEREQEKATQKPSPTKRNVDNEQGFTF